MFKKDLLFFLTASVALAAIESPFPSIIAFIIVLLYLKFTERIYLVENLLASLLLAIVWVSFAKENYNYSTGFTYIHGVCLFPVLVWCLGLFGVSMLLSNSERFNNASPLTRLVIHSSVLWVCLIAVEILAYHVFGFRNKATLSYPPIPVINCIHAPRWMQIMYFLLAPIYGTMMAGIQFVREFNWSVAESDIAE